jgi:hypothetical protein
MTQIIPYRGLDGLRPSRSERRVSEMQGQDDWTRAQEYLTASGNGGKVVMTVSSLKPSAERIRSVRGRMRHLRGKGTEAFLHDRHDDSAHGR